MSLRRTQCVLFIVRFLLMMYICSNFQHVLWTMETKVLKSVQSEKENNYPWITDDDVWAGGIGSDGILAPSQRTEEQLSGA